MPRQVLRGPQCQLDTGGAADDAHRLERIDGVSTGRPGPHGPAGSRRPASTTPTCCGWRGSDASSTAISSSVGRRSFGMRSTARVSEVGSTTWAIANSADVDRAAGHVAPQRFQQPGQQCGRQLRAVGLQRVEHLGGVAARIVGGQTPLVEHAGGQERRRQYLDVAVERQRLSDGAAALLDGGEAAAGRRLRQHRRDDLQALQPQHLFDEVGGLREGRAASSAGSPSPGRRRSTTTWRRSGSAACCGGAVGVVDACGAVGQVDGHA